MSFQSNLKEKTKLELGKLKQMSWKDRIWYIIEYYKYHMVILVMLGCLVYLIASSIYRQTFNDVLYCAMVNNYGYGAMNTEYFQDGFHEYGNFGPKDLVTVDSSMTINYMTQIPELDETSDDTTTTNDTTTDDDTTTTNDTTTNNDSTTDASSDTDISELMFSPSANMNGEAEYASMMKLTAMITAKALDVVIMDAVNMETFAAQQMTLNLETMLPNDLFTSLKEADRIVYTTLEDGTTIPSGVRLAGTNAETIGNIRIEDPIFTIVANTRNPENAVLFLQYLLGY